MSDEAESEGGFHPVKHDASLTAPGFSLALSASDQGASVQTVTHGVASGGAGSSYLS